MINDKLTVGLLLLMVSTFVTEFVMAGILGQLYGSLVISLYPWANVFWLQSLIYAVIIIFMVFLVPKTDKASTKTTKTNFSAQLAKLLINKSLLPCYIITVSLPMIVSVIGIRAGKQGGNAITLYTFVLFIGATIGPIICNHIMDTSGSYSLTFIFLAIVLCISFLVSLMARRTYKIS